MYLNYGKVFKYEEDYEKSLIAFEESYYLSCILDNKLEYKIEILTLISSCYLKLNDLNRMIIYNKKLINIENDLIQENDEKILNKYMNVNLRIAIRQNIYNALFTLNSLNDSIYYLIDLINLIDKQLNENNFNSKEWFKYLKLKLNTLIELFKLYLFNEDYILLDEKLIETMNYLDEFFKTNGDKQINMSYLIELKCFKIKIFNYLSICKASLGNNRLSLQNTRKASSLLDKLKSNIKENQFSTADGNDTKKTCHLSSLDLNKLEIECLLKASDSCDMRLAVKNRLVNDELLKSELNNNNNDDESKLNDNELKLNYLKEAYLKSRLIIDPKIQIECLFKYSKSLFNNFYYQTSLHYFNQIKLISKTLLLNDSDVNDFINNKLLLLSDFNPDYHLETSIYECACLLNIHYGTFTSFKCLFLGFFKVFFYQCEPYYLDFTSMDSYSGKKTVLALNLNNKMCLESLSLLLAKWT